MSSYERALRFSVGHPGGLRSEIWKCWTPGKGKSDVYLAPRTIGGEFKLSGHGPDVLKLGLTAEFKKRMIKEERWLGGSRLAYQVPYPEATIKGARLLHRILVPAAAMTRPVSPDEAREDIVWLSAPPDNLVSQTTILIIPAGTNIERPPAGSDAPIRLVGHFPLDSGEEVWLLHSEAPMPQLGRKTGSPSKFAPSRSTSDNLTGMRALVILETNGHPTGILECIINDQRPA